MWGRHVEVEMKMATRDAKNNKEAERKALAVITRLLAEEEDSELPATTRSRFRDPAAAMKK